MAIIEGGYIVKKARQICTQDMLTNHNVACESIEEDNQYWGTVEFYSEYITTTSFLEDVNVVTCQAYGVTESRNTKYTTVYYDTDDYGVDWYLRIENTTKYSSASNRLYPPEDYTIPSMSVISLKTVACSNEF